MQHVNVRTEFEASIENPRVTAYIWFLCNGLNGSSQFVGLGIGRRQLGGQGPVKNGNRPIPEDVMARLQQGFDHWFGWEPVTLNAASQENFRQLPLPPPPHQISLRRVTADHKSFPHFEALIEGEEELQAALTTSSSSFTTPLVLIEADLENLRREQIEPHSEGYVYLIHMRDTTFYKIGMSFDPQMRVRTLQTGNPHRLEILHTKEVQDMRSAEADLHRRFEARRVPNLNAREWFDFGTSTGIDEVETAFDKLQ
ncbi:MAG: hypothetical protein MMC33_002075 [Icmadophila ericetorum]|nr:hypothetical protein [Icmadophila ericetorum]